MIYYIENPELYHYGVKGMKWGVRHDPERVGRRPSSYNSSSFIKRKNTYNNKSVHKQKRSLSTAKKVAIGLAVAAGIAGGSYYLYKTGKFSQLSALGRNAIANIGGTKTDIAIDTQMISSINKAHVGTPGGTMNCSHCSVSYILNSVLGKSTTAKPFVENELGSVLSGKYGVHENTIDLIFDNTKKINLTGSAKTAFDLKSIGSCKKYFTPNSTGIVFVQDGFGMGHYVNYSTNGRGITKIVDAQSNEVLSLDAFSGRGWLARSIFDCSDAKLAEGAELYLKHMVNGL